jgi:hypothetical protein
MPNENSSKNNLPFLYLMSISLGGFILGVVDRNGTAKSLALVGGMKRGKFH